MFSFHRPKVYRSSTGCCICKAKSSSSRFTDSKKYEEDFLECFKLAQPRQGEICNACVLLVKRWKKLPAGSGRNWQHVVDARAGPGMKSFTKFKTRNKRLNEEKNGEKKKKKHFEREYSPALSDNSDAPEDMEIGDVDFLSEEGPSMNSSRNASPGISEIEDTASQKNCGRRRKGKARRNDELPVRDNGFIDLDYWKREIVCCGTIYRGQNDEVMIDPSLYKPCQGRLAMCKAKAIPQTLIEPSVSKFSDNSSDSGYDESSNQGIAMSPEMQANHVTEQGNSVIGHGNPVVRQGNSVSVQRNVVTEQKNVVLKQENDLKCYEDPLEAIEAQQVVSVASIVGCYEEIGQTVMN